MSNIGNWLSTSLVQFLMVKKLSVVVKERAQAPPDEGVRWPKRQMNKKIIARILHLYRIMCLKIFCTIGYWPHTLCNLCLFIKVSLILQMFELHLTFSIEFLQKIVKVRYWFFKLFDLLQNEIDLFHSFSPIWGKNVCT